jgi:hypothetical protein
MKDQYRFQFGTVGLHLSGTGEKAVCGGRHFEYNETNYYGMICSYTEAVEKILCMYESCSK